MSRIKILFGIIICLTVLTVNVAAERPTVIITFDDGWRSVSDKAYPIMQANDQKGVSFVYVLSIIGGYPDFMQQDRLNMLYEAGWDISSHTYSHVNLTSVNSTTLYYELSASYDWLNTNGYTRSAMFLAYPEGSYNAAVIEAVQANHYLAARTVDRPDADYSNYNLTSPNNYMLKAYDALGGIDNDSTVIDQINNTITANGLLILAFHKIVDNLSTNPSDALTEFKTSDFQNVSNYLQSRSSDVDVRTLSDYFGEKSEPIAVVVTETPANPTSTPTTVPTKGMPGFEIVTAIAVICMLGRKKK